LKQPFILIEKAFQKYVFVPEYFEGAGSWITKNNLMVVV
ncbi:hypothetical protein TNCT_135081, partial [Trichonephila clavata]